MDNSGEIGRINENQTSSSSSSSSSNSKLIYININMFVPSVISQCWLGNRQGIWPATVCLKKSQKQSPGPTCFNSWQSTS